ncbi:hypothetical protein ABZT49_13700 [Methylobacterium sp. EM32]|uniref:hypothetical protein n=1 Tax=Methylobacterium sp. EM32 TaxID=3163481 RepID=UPI0033B35B4B
MVMETDDARLLGAATAVPPIKPAACACNGCHPAPDGMRSIQNVTIASDGHGIEYRHNNKQ